MPENTVRFGEYSKEVSVRQHRISYRDLAPKIERDAHGKPIPYKPPKLKITFKDASRILKPYISVRLMEQVSAVFPLGAYLMGFQYLILRQNVVDSLVITGGLLSVIIGLMLYMEGLKLGIMPFGEAIGNTLPTKSPMPVVLLIAFILGVGVTFAEPAIGALQVAGAAVKAENAPILYALLNDWSLATVLCVGLGVGVAATIGTMRFIYGWSLKPLIYLSVTPTSIITGICYFYPNMRTVIGLAWDCGAVTTGPVTVPLVLALGIGVASAVGKGDSSLAGFGIVTLASVFPIMAVMLLGIYVNQTVPVETILASAAAKAAAAAETAGPKAWWEVTPGFETYMSFRAIVPLILFLFFVMKVVLREKIRNAGILTYGITLAVIGMILFNIGLTYGLAKLGDQSGGLVPAAFMHLEKIQASPLYFYALGITIAMIFAWVLGFGATLAEPALNALGLTVENLSNGAFKKSSLMYAVAFGVAVGIALGVLKILYNWPLAWMLIGSYIPLLIMTSLSSEEYVNIGWDSAGVTTGPVTVPLVLAMGLGFGNAVNALEGFGILSMASVCPIISVIAVGLFVQWKTKRLKMAQEARIQPAEGAKA
ncbi:DUF1538 domain-containing protein [bacterium]|nr:DUF1538 domain-containing protein [bacterium]